MNGCEWLSLRSALARFVNFSGGERTVYEPRTAAE